MLGYVLCLERLRNLPKAKDKYLDYSNVFLIITLRIKLIRSASG